jgi:hypothetical protein
MAIVGVIIVYIFVNRLIFSLSVSGMNPDEQKIVPAMWTCLADFIFRIIKILVDIYMIISFIDM